MKTILFRTSLVGRWKLYLLALGLLGATSNVFGQGPTFTTIDFPGAASTTPWGINTRGDIVGLYTNADKSTHGFLLSGGQYSTVDFPGASGSELYGLNPAGDVVGVYTLDGVRQSTRKGTSLGTAVPSLVVTC